MVLKYFKMALNGDENVQEMAHKVIEDNNIEIVIETGTHTGLSTAFFSHHCKKVITTEINHGWLMKAKDSLKESQNIEFFEGDAATILKQELPKLENKKILFFLDAHFNNDLALDRELETIAESKVIPYIIIHDFKVPNREDLDYDGWDGKEYSFPNFKSLIEKIYPKGYKYYYNDSSAQNQRGCVFIEPKNEQ